jgi:hypothetical protein
VSVNVHRPIFWLLLAAISGVAALFLSVDLTVAVGPTAIDSVRAGPCPDAVDRRGCVVVSHGTVVATRTYFRRRQRDAHELTLDDARGRHLELMTDDPAFAELVAGTTVEERRLDGRLLSVTLPDGGVLPVEVSPLDAAWSGVLTISFALLGAVVGALQLAEARRHAGWFEPVSARFRLPPLPEPARTLIGLGFTAYGGAALGGLLMYMLFSASVGAGAVVGAVVGSAVFGFLRLRQRRRSGLPRAIVQQVRRS